MIYTVLCPELGSHFLAYVTCTSAFGDDHLIPRLRGTWHFLEINILTLKILKIYNLASSGKEINNLTLTNFEYLYIQCSNGCISLYTLYRY